jgi:two-component system, LytTR family, sensor kinase
MGQRSQYAEKTRSRGGGQHPSFTDVFGQLTDFSWRRPAPSRIVTSMPAHSSRAASQSAPTLVPRLPQYLVAMLHVGYWGLYLILLTVLIIGTRSGMRPGRVLFGTSAGFLLIVPNVVAFYVQYFLLTPRLFPKRRFGTLTALTVLTALATSMLCGAVLAISAGKVPPVFQDWKNAVAFIAWLAVLALIHMTIAMVMRGFISWYDDIAVKEQLTRRTGEVEAALIRAKLDPHFLFNTLNNIDVLIMRDAVAASQYLNQLSDILRFVLYEARSERVPLSAELAYFDKYIALQRIRIANPKLVSYELNGATDNLLIAPMLLIPFVENAFKHAAGQRDDHSIVVAISVDDAHLTFVCSNGYQPARRTQSADSSDLVAGGLGQELIQTASRASIPEAPLACHFRQQLPLLGSLDTHARHSNRRTSCARSSLKTSRSHSSGSGNT